MSQLYLKVKDGVKFGDEPVKEFMCGLDRPLQHWFFQIWGGTDEDEPLNSPESLMGCSRGELLEAIETYCDMTDEHNIEVSTMIALDLDTGADQYGN